MSLTDAGYGGGAVGAMLTTIYLLRPYFRFGRPLSEDANGSYKGDSPRSIREAIQEARDKDMLDRLKRVEEVHASAHKEMMECMREQRDLLRDIKGAVTR